VRGASQVFRSARIRALNDAFRSDIDNATAAIHEGVIEMFGRIGLPAIIEGVRTFDAFTPDDGDHHDNGAFSVFGVTVMWAIQYADLAMQGPSSNPADPHVTKRILVLALADAIAEEGDSRTPVGPVLRP
jgi:hypothetical protein